MKLAPGPKQKEHNSSMDGLAIVIRGNKATKNVATGDLVLVERSTISGVTDGGYKALANVSAGTAFTSANLSALSNGGLNALNDQIANRLNWTLKDTKTGNATVALPTNFTEILVVSTNSNLSGDTRMAIIPKVLFPSSGTITVSQGATSATQIVSWALTSTTISLATWNFNSSTQVADCTTKVYYR